MSSANTRNFSELLTELPKIGQTTTLRETLRQLDVGIWMSVHETCCTAPRDAQSMFGLPPRLVDMISGLERDRVLQMASGIRLSFIPVCTDETFTKLEEAFSEELEPSALTQLSDPLLTHYWQTAARLASTSTIEASAILGVPDKFAQILARPDATITRIAQLLPVLGEIRFRARLSVEDLRRALGDTSARSTLRCINLGLSGAWGKAEGTTPPQTLPRLNPTIKGLQAKTLAITLLERGYSRKIVQIETGLTAKSVGTLGRSLRESNPAGCEGSLHLKRKKSRGIIRNTRDYIVASILMQSYVVHCRDIDPYASIDLLALEAALEHHRECVAALNAQEARPVWRPFGASDAWELANELRSGTALMRDCDNCGGNYYDGCDLYIRRDCPHCYHELTERNREKKSKTSDGCSKSIP